MVVVAHDVHVLVLAQDDLAETGGQQHAALAVALLATEGVGVQPLNVLLALRVAGLAQHPGVLLAHADISDLGIYRDGLEVELRRDGEGLAQHIAEGQRDDHAALAVQRVGKGAGEIVAVLFQQRLVLFGQIRRFGHGGRCCVLHASRQFLIRHPPSPPLFCTIQVGNTT